MPPAYAELQVTTNFTFLRGASHAEELVETAAALGQAALAVTDRNTLAGIVRGHAAAKRHGLRYVPGARLDFLEGISLLAWPTDRAAYGRLSQLITLGARRAPKGECHLNLADLEAHAEGLRTAIVAPERADWRAGPLGLDDGFQAMARHLARLLKGRIWLAAAPRFGGDDAAWFESLERFGQAIGAPLLASNDVRYHRVERRTLLDVMTCIREGTTIDAAGPLAARHGERHLKPPAEMARLFARHPEAVARTVQVLDGLTFSLDELRYEYPAEPVAEGRSPQEELARLAWAGAAWRWPGGVSDKVQATIRHELALIEKCGFAPYFLTVRDIVAWARDPERNPPILCQGRGSAANSVVCFCLGITSVSPDKVDVLFERFVSEQRGEPPDIDVDFEHERREEVIQYIYRKYGRDRAGLAATLIRYRTRSAIRDVGKALGLSLDVVAALSGTTWGWSDEGLDPAHVREIGLDPEAPRLRLALRLASILIGFPRHLSQHVGGFVITRGPLSEVVPITNAAMDERTVVEWDKDDLDALGILKIDVLALGMLTCIRKGLDMLGIPDMAKVPEEDPRVYDMLCKADSVGVFQVESRAQMTMLPRLKPRCYYDLVIEVAIVRPGPIQGDMVHPYLRRRNGLEEPDLPSPELREVLGKTLGVPLFQEQAMRIAIVAAGFTPDAADGLRRAMATFRHVGTIHQYEAKMVEGMVARGYDRDFATRCFRQIQGFGEYGFPESHAASFALLVYVSAWLKCHYPAVFACALLNSQPMGFYQPAQLVRDAQQHGVTVLPVDIAHSAWDCTIEGDPKAGGRLRLGFRQVKGLQQAELERLVAARASGPFTSLPELARRSGLSHRALELLAEADACRSLGLDRRRALWMVRSLAPPTAAARAPASALEALPLFRAAADALDDRHADAALPQMTLGEHVIHDYARVSLSLKAHPLSFLRESLAAQGVRRAAYLATLRNNARVSVAGLVLVRQRPGSAKGVIFVTLEDETGVANLVVWPPVFEAFRRIVLGARLLRAFGRLQAQDGVIHVVVEQLVDLSPQLDRLATLDRPLVPPLSNADEFKHPQAPRGRVMPRSRDFH
ncbi:error-prone DNA polymerase [Zavarzinia sp. CC-PAN008]|uniref:error-prone DNA polymerase n=1 Tax=Zavarzinia sp. CC-PAN008 TaxID=3243332 RepID=UPI003F74241B